MAAVTTELKVLVRAVGKNDLDKISASLTKLGKAASGAVNPKVKESVGELRKLSNQSVKTKANIQGFSNAFKDLANNLEFGSKEFKEATAEAARLDAQLKKLETRKPPTRAQRLRRGAQTAGAIAAGGVFGGPEGAIGAGIGGIVGGPAGAAVGAALGAQVGQLRQALGATADYAANLAKLRIALKGVSGSQQEFADGLTFIQKTTEDFAIPQEIITRQFTKLQASVAGAGGNLEDTKTAFNGIVAAVRATGGSLSDVDAALTATAQVFSKGKVSAEELRQQIGERLPGAFTLFAESMELTPAELDKALEGGKVTLQDFQKFAEELFERYGDTAQEIADSPDAAGDRLKVVLERLNENVGTLLKPIGAAFQVTFTNIIEFIDAATARLNLFLELGAQGTRNKVKRLSEDINRLLKKQEERKPLIAAGLIRPSDIREVEQQLEAKRQQLQTAQAVLRDLTGFGAASEVRQSELPGGDDDDDTSTNQKIDASETLLDLAQKLNAATLSGNEFAIISAKLAFDKQKIEESTLLPREKAIRLLDLEGKANKAILRLLSAKPEKVKNLVDELTEVDKLFNSIKDTVATGLANAIQGLIDGTKSLGESLSGILRQLGSMVLQFGMKSIVGSIFGSANGNIVANNKIVPFAYGGIVDKPTLFPMANGAGLMGEAGPEAIMPLRRNASGRLGVEASGGGVGNVVVNVDASGSTVQGDDANAARLGNSIAAAIQAELIKQQRPGGLLSR
jgi:tape measure domain-containing protein